MKGGTNVEAIQFIDLKQQYQLLQTNIKQAINDVLEHGQFILGPEVKTFEDNFQDMTGAKHVISCSSGTDALKCLLLAMNIGPKDAVLVPTFTFAATAEMVALLHATPIFVDICQDTFNIDLLSLDKAYHQAKQLGLQVKGIIAVDLFGLPAAYPALQEFADAHKMWLISDAAQSFGGQIGNNKVGTLAHMNAFSFFPSKPLGAYGDGGAITTSDAQLAEKLRALRVHGATTSRFNHHYIGINSRLDSIQAAILNEKLKIFDAEYQKRQVIVDHYTRHLDGLVICPEIPKDYQSAWALYTVKCTPSHRDKIEQRFQIHNIPYSIYYKQPLHLQTAYKDFPRASECLTSAEKLSHEVISLPMHPYLTEEQVAFIAEQIRAAKT